MGAFRSGRAHMCGVGVLLALALTACGGSPADDPAPAATSAGSPSADRSRPANSSAPAGPAAAGPTAGATSGTVPPAGVPAPSRPTPAPGRSVRTDGVTLVRTGGIAGLTDTITVRPDGVWQRNDKKGPVDDGRLTTAQQATLRKLLADPRLAAEVRRPAGDGGRCSDTFTYLLVTPRGVVRYTQCPGTGTSPQVTMRIVTLLLGATGA